METNDMEHTGLADKIDADKNDIETREYPKPDDTGTTDKIQYDEKGNILWVDHIDENGYSKYTDFYDKDGNIEMTSVYIRDEDGNNLSVTTYDGDGNLIGHDDLEKDGSAEAVRDDIVDSIYDALGVNDMDANPGDIDSIDVSMDDLLSDYFSDIGINEVTPDVDDIDSVDGKEEFSFEAFSVNSDVTSGRD